jgi:hypothetical protein
MMRGALPLIHTVAQPLAELFDERDFAHGFREFGLPDFLSWAGHLWASATPPARARRPA